MLAPHHGAALGIVLLLVGVYVALVLGSWGSGNLRPAAHRGSTGTPVAAAPLRLDPNVATAAELELLPGVGPTVAANIIAYRESAERQPAFTRPEDLDAVPRIGPVTIERLRPHLRFPQ